MKGNDNMITELRQKSQITIPKELVLKLGLSEGDKLDIFEKDGAICIVPVVVYPKKYVDSLINAANEVKSKIDSGEQPIFDSVDDMIKALEKNDEI